MKQILILVLVLGGLSSMAAAEPYVCPDLSVGETLDDCPWAAVARELSETGEGVMPRLKALLPDLYKQVQTDSKKTALKNLWGQSYNFDEIAKATTVHPSIIDALSGFFGVATPKENIAHAGLAHTYAYLFSTLKTPFGYKRDRWVSGKIEDGLGIERGVFGPKPSQGTLFANVTYFSGRIAFEYDPKEKAVIRGIKDAAQALRSFKYDDLKTVRLEETVTVEGREVVLRTDLVPFAKATPKNAFLLVYSVVDSGSAKLITAFPVDAAFGQRVKDTEVGEGKPVQSRYNAYVRGLSGKTIAGKKELIVRE